MADELGVDARLAHAAGDELAVLPAEVDDEDRPLLRLGLGVGRRTTSPISSVCSWGRPW